MSCAWRSDVRLCIFLLMTTFTKMEDTINVTVGENVKLECPFIFGFLFTGPMVEEEIRWTGGNDGPILGICNKYRNEWEDYLPNDGFTFEHADGCDKNVVSIEARKPGQFSYVCSLWRVGSEVDRLVNNMTFSVNVSCSNESLLECNIRQLPSKFPQWSQLVDINCEDPCGVENSSDAIEIHFEMNNEILHPDVVFSSHITLRENISWIRERSSQIYCVSHNKSTACEVASRNTTIRIKPLMNRVFEGETATFECIYEGMGMNPEYEWWISRHDQLSRISRSISPILNISNVSPTDDGIDVRCNCEVNEEILTAWATLDVHVATVPAQTVTSSALSSTDVSPLKYTNSSEERVSSNATNVYTTDNAMSRVYAFKIAIIVLSVSLALAFIITSIILALFMKRRRINSAPVSTSKVQKNNLETSLTVSIPKQRQPPEVHPKTSSASAPSRNAAGTSNGHHPATRQGSVLSLSLPPVPPESSTKHIPISPLDKEVTSISTNGFSKLIYPELRPQYQETELISYDHLHSHLKISHSLPKRTLGEQQYQKIDLTRTISTPASPSVQCIPELPQQSSEVPSLPLSKRDVPLVPELPSRTATSRTENLPVCGTKLAHGSSQQMIENCDVHTYAEVNDCQLDARSSTFQTDDNHTKLFPDSIVSDSIRRKGDIECRDETIDLFNYLCPNPDLKHNGNDDGIGTEVHIYNEIGSYYPSVDKCRGRSSHIYEQLTPDVALDEELENAPKSELIPLYFTLETNTAKSLEKEFKDDGPQ